MFKFEYKMINKYDVSNNAGFHFIIDSEYEYIEYFLLNNLGDITNRKLFKLSISKKEEIYNILINNKDIFKLNSFIYLEGDNNYKEQFFIVELDDLNREIKGYNLFKDDLIIVNVFNEIKDILKDVMDINLY